MTKPRVTIIGLGLIGGSIGLGLASSNQTIHIVGHDIDIRQGKLAQKMGFDLVIRKEPGTGFVSIKCQPKDELDLTKLYELLKQKDTKADWYFHPSKHIILNGSRHNPKVKPSSLSLEELIEITKSVQ